MDKTDDEDANLQKMLSTMIIFLFYFYFFIIIVVHQLSIIRFNVPR